MIKQPMAFLFGALLMAPAAQAEIITFDPSFTYRELELRKIDTGIWPQSLLLGLMGELNKAKDRTEVLEQVKAAILANDYASDKGHEALVLKNAVFGFDRDLKDLRLSDLAGRKDFAGAMFIAGSSLGKADFREADFTDAMMKNCRLVRANLRQATLKGANLENADLTGCNLTGANLSGAVLVGTRIHTGVLESIAYAKSLQPQYLHAVPVAFAAAAGIWLTLSNLALDLGFAILWSSLGLIFLISGTIVLLRFLRQPEGSEERSGECDA